MEHLLAHLRAAAEPTRLRLLALAARGAFCVIEFTEILGQSQPRLSRHLKLLCEAGLLERVPRRRQCLVRPAAPAPAGALARANCSPACRRMTPSWQPTAGRPPGCWPSAPASPRKVSAATAPTGTRCARWTCRPTRSRTRCWPLTPAATGRMLDIGTGTGRRAGTAGPAGRPGSASTPPRPCWRSPAPGLPGRDSDHCAVRQADMYRLPLPDAGSTSSCCRWCCTMPRTRPARWPRPPACCGPVARSLLIDLAAHDRRRPD